MKNLRATKYIVLALCVLAVVGLVAASTVCAMHSVDGEHCQCPVCCAFSAVGGVLAVFAMCALACRLALRRRAQSATARVPMAQPLRTVKFNC